MWTTLAIASALTLAPAQGGKLEIKNDRITYGILGQERKETKFLAGDVFVVSFDIEGLQVNAKDGKVRYSMGLELINDKTGKPEFTTEPQELETVNALGGSRLPAFAMSTLGTDTMPGTYTMKVTVTDLAANPKQKVELTKKFEVIPRKFGFVKVGLFNVNGAGAGPAPPIGVPGQTIAVTAAVVGFELDDKTNANLAFEMQILDETGKPTLTQPFTGEAKNIPQDQRKLLALNFAIALNRPGKFTIELKATDKLAKGQPIVQTLSFTVIEPPK
jgi:hypothetical protein